MPQDRDTGAAANEFGRATARKIATKIGATEIQRSSNECRVDGEKIVIKCARVDTPSIGVTYKMLDHLDGILGAFELELEKPARVPSGVRLRCGALKKNHSTIYARR